MRALVVLPSDTRLCARQFALSCDPTVISDSAPDLVLKFTILCSGKRLVI
jgi:hypothetical protein